LDSAKDKEGKPILANEVGSTVSFVQLFEQHKETAFPNTKAFMLAAWDEKEEAMGGAEFVAGFKAACAKEQPLRGALVRYETRQTTTKKDVEICIPVFRSVPGQDEASLTKGRAFLDTVAKAAEEKKAS
jgi:hypothetical protein